MWWADQRVRAGCICDVSVCFIWVVLFCTRWLSASACWCKYCCEELCVPSGSWASQRYCVGSAKPTAARCFGCVSTTPGLPVHSSWETAAARRALSRTLRAGIWGNCSSSGKNNARRWCAELRKSLLSVDKSSIFFRCDDASSGCAEEAPCYCLPLLIKWRACFSSLAISLRGFHYVYFMFLECFWQVKWCDCRHP